MEGLSAREWCFHSLADRCMFFRAWTRAALTDDLLYPTTALVFTWGKMAHGFTFDDGPNNRGRPGLRRDETTLVLSQTDDDVAVSCRDERHARLESDGLQRGGWAARTMEWYRIRATYASSTV